jgi:ferredoxin
MRKVMLDREHCIGCSACVGVCPKFWEMGSDGKTTLKNSKRNDGGWYELEVKDADVDCNRQAAQACPVDVIRVVE